MQPDEMKTERTARVSRIIDNETDFASTNMEL